MQCASFWRLSKPKCSHGQLRLNSKWRTKRGLPWIVSASPSNTPSSLDHERTKCAKLRSSCSTHLVDWNRWSVASNNGRGLDGAPPPRWGCQMGTADGLGPGRCRDPKKRPSHIREGAARDRAKPSPPPWSACHQVVQTFTLCCYRRTSSMRDSLAVEKHYRVRELAD